MTFEVTILGSSSASPTYQRHPSAQIINISERFFLVDCGEGTQIQLERYKIKYHRINRVFISHLHGDHFFGLMGLLSTMHLQGRTKELNLYAPKELKEIIDIQLLYSQTKLRYEIIYHDLKSDKSAVIFEDEHLIIETIILNHRIPCTGFLFREKRKPRKLIKELINKYEIPVSVYTSLKMGKDYIDESGKIYKNDLLTEPSKSARSYAYCSDTAYNEAMLEQLKDVDLLYHEATFLDDMIDRANETYHTTAKQAGITAKKANVKRLLIGHFSARYKELDSLLNEAKIEFPNTELALEGVKFIIE
jgi:ribonuclease Z